MPDFCQLTIIFWIRRILSHVIFLAVDSATSGTFMGKKKFWAISVMVNGV
jgi:hypothetical protein